MSDYELINTGINLLTGIGTVGAVVVALYLARKQNQPRLMINNSLNRLYRMPGVSSEQVFVQVSATNTGTIRERVTTFGYSIGFFRWKLMAQTNPSTNSFEAHTFPAFIEPSERVSDFIEIELFNELQMGIFTNFFDGLPLPYGLKRRTIVLKILMCTARCWVSPARGNIVYALPDKRFRNHVIAQYQQQRDKISLAC